MKETQVRKIELFDTSLRDGMQQPNLDISVQNAVMLLQRMSTFGVHYAEIGFAGANQFVSDLTGALTAANMGSMKLALFGRSRGRGVKVKDWPDVQFIIANKRRVGVAVVVVKSRLLDIAKSLETTPEANLLMVSETIQYLQENGLEVLVDFEHAMDAACGRRENGNPCDADLKARSLDYFHQVVGQCVRDQVSRLVICDTTGGASPEEVAHVIGELARSASRGSVRFSWPHGSRSGRRQQPCRYSCRSSSGAGHSARNWRALRQCEPDHGCRRHATQGRS